MDKTENFPLAKYLPSIGDLSKSRTLRSLERKMEQAKTYQDWYALAARHDELSGANEWKQEEDSDQFDAAHIRSRYDLLSELVARGDIHETLFALNEGIHGNMGGMGKSLLYKRAKLGTKNLITKYVEATKSALRVVADAPESEIAFDEKLDFFRRASHCFGRSALSMSGGAGLLYFHHGVVETLIENDLLPNVLSGSSAGSWMCAQLGTLTNSELKNYFIDKRYDFKQISSFKEMREATSSRNVEFAKSDRDDVIDSFIGDMTFQEAFEKTGRYINISIAPAERHQTSRLMNAITSPNVTIRSATKASSSPPGLVAPVALEAKDSHGKIKPYLRNRRWVDGGVSEDLPFKRVSRLFGVNHFIVSMINPLVVIFMREDPKTAGESVKKSVSRVAFFAFKEYLKTLQRLASPKVFSKVDAMIGTMYQMMDQKYAGDVNIVMSNKHLRMRNLTFNYKDDNDIVELIREGMRATWPKLDLIRNSTSISHEIDEILTELEQDAIVFKHDQHKKHIII